MVEDMARDRGRRPQVLHAGAAYDEGAAMIPAARDLAAGFLARAPGRARPTGRREGGPNRPAGGYRAGDTGSCVGWSADVARVCRAASGSHPCLCHRVRTHAAGKDERRSMGERGDIRLLDGAHRLVKAPLVSVWDWLNTHVSRTMRVLVVERAWPAVFPLPAPSPDLNPVEGVWAHVKRSLTNLAVVALGRLETLVRDKLKRLRRRPDVLDGFIAGTGLTLDTPTSPRRAEVGNVHGRRHPLSEPRLSDKRHPCRESPEPGFHHGTGATARHSAARPPPRIAYRQRAARPALQRSAATASTRTRSRGNRSGRFDRSSTPALFIQESRSSPRARPGAG